MSIYADTSFFVSLYGADVHSGSARRLVSTHPLVWFTPLHRAEWVHAITQHVFQNRISAAEAQSLFRHLEADRATGLWVETGLPETVFDLCSDLARRYGARFGVRTLDSLHVACALQLKAKQFWTFDDRQARLARVAGLSLP